MINILWLYRYIWNNSKYVIDVANVVGQSKFCSMWWDPLAIWLSYLPSSFNELFCIIYIFIEIWSWPRKVSADFVFVQKKKKNTNIAVVRRIFLLNCIAFIAKLHSCKMYIRILHGRRKFSIGRKKRKQTLNVVSQEIREQLHSAKWSTIFQQYEILIMFLKIYEIISMNNVALSKGLDLAIVANFAAYN